MSGAKTAADRAWCAPVNEGVKVAFAECVLVVDEDVVRRAAVQHVSDFHDFEGLNPWS